ncbi:MAG: S8 family serine peptidase, partial [Candidatus Bathyarchaeia archaeon]
MPHHKRKLFGVFALTFVIVSSTFLSLAESSLFYEKFELILKLKSGVSGSYVEDIVRHYNLKVVDEILRLNLLIVSVPGNILGWVEGVLKRDFMVEFVERNVEVSVMAVPNDYYYAVQWHLQKVGMPIAWDVSKGDSNILIAVLDTGVDVNHPDLSGKLVEGFNVYYGTGDVVDDYGHGTMVAGVAAAITNNGLGISAPAWNCKILPVKVNLPGSGSTTFSLLAKGLVYAADRGAKVACISWQVFNGSGTLAEAAKYFVDKGGIVVAAAGNTGKYENYNDSPYIVSVAATENGDSPASFSSYGPYVDLAAPGVGIFTTISGMKASSYDVAYGYASGTSFSTPLTAGVAALIYSVNPSFTPAQVEQILESSALDLGEAGYDFHYGWGRLDAAKALKMAISSNGSSTLEDTVPPEVFITQPLDGAVVSGKILVKVDARDNFAVSKVELYKDGKLFASRVGAPYDFVWDTTVDLNGVYSLQAKAYDYANNLGESGFVTVKVNNPLKDRRAPSVKIVNPRNRATVYGVVKV